VEEATIGFPFSLSREKFLCQETTNLQKEEKRRRGEGIRPQSGELIFHIAKKKFPSSNELLSQTHTHIRERERKAKIKVVFLHRKGILSRDLRD